MKKNSIINIKITNIAEDGSGIGRLDNMVIFVRGMLPGEEGEILIIKITKSYAIGKLQNLTTMSPARITPPICENFSKGCGGCTFCHFNYHEQLEYKQTRVIDCLERIGNFKDIAKITKHIIEAPKLYGYRNKAIYPFGLDSNKNIICGFYASASHRIIPLSISGCKLENDSSRLIREFTVDYAVENKFSVYNEDTGNGFLRALMVRTNKFGKAMVVLIVNGTSKDLSILKKYALSLIEKHKFTESVYACFNNKNTNVILNGELHLLYGKDTISDIIGNFKAAPAFEISPMSFYQVNPTQTERLYDAVYSVLPKNSKLIYDIYCGIGTIGIYILSRLKQDNSHNSTNLVGVEYVEAAVENARKNALDNGFYNVSEFFQGDASKITPLVLKKYGTPSVIILDPPRKGCDEELINTVLSAYAENIIYVSCNPATLARDLKLLCLNKYECTSVQPVDMFPHSGHVETVVCLSRKKVNDRINFDINIEALPDRVSKTATYAEIKAYVLEHYGFKVSSLYIAQIIDKHGIKERENYNIGEGKSKELICPPEKEEAITNALKHFNMI